MYWVRCRVYPGQAFEILHLSHSPWAGTYPVSDAIVFIVSEEAGTVMMARAGQMIEIDYRRRSPFDWHSSTCAEFARLF
jgi:hypothetical protein